MSRLICLVVLSIACLSTTTADAARPNFVVLLADDLGFGDITSKRMPLSTPLAARGTRLNLYAHQNCMPTRVALLTGRYPYEFNIPSVYPPPLNPGLPHYQRLISDRLKLAGYTCGMYGKWHLGWRERSLWPTRRGFDEFIGMLGGHINSYGTQKDGFPYDDGNIGHDHHGFHDMQVNEVPLYTSRYSTEIFRDAAMEFIEKKSSQSQPFFLYVPFNAPHGPFSAPRRYVDQAIQTGDFDASLKDRLIVRSADVLTADYSNPQDVHDTAKLMYAAAVLSLDQAVDAIYRKLEETGVADNTFFIFASDNGVSYTFDPSATRRVSVPVGSSAPLRGAKGSVFEAGFRVANFAIWPGKISPGQKVDSNIWIGDLPATFLTLAGARVPSSIDGANIMPAIESGASLVRPKFGRHIVPYMIKFRTTRADLPQVTHAGQIAMIWKWRKYIRQVYFDADGELVLGLNERLYDIVNDPGERTNLAAALPTVLANARRAYEGIGGDGLFDKIDLIPTGGWHTVERTLDFGFDSSTPILETDVVP